MAAEHVGSVILLGSGDTQTGGGGSTIEAILRCSALGLIGVSIDGIICNNSRKKVPGFYDLIDKHNEKFRTNVRIETVNGVRYPAASNEVVGEGAQTLAEAQVCVDMMNEFGSDAYALAGFMKKVAGAMLKRKGLNTHPGPLEDERGLPGVDTKGLHGLEVSEAVIERGYPYSAHTAHEVVEDYDSGCILAFHPVLVRPGENAEELFERVKEVEKANYPRDIEDYVRSLRA